MLERKITNTLQEWKKEEKKPCLLIRGARQVGKTYIIDDIASGSLLGLYYKEVSSYPVGYERVIDLYPLDFEEFLWGIGIKKETIEYAKQAFENKKPMDEYILKQLSEQFKMYILVGGMPKIVDEYVKTSSL